MPFPELAETLMTTLGRGPAMPDDPVNGQKDGEPSKTTADKPSSAPQPVKLSSYVLALFPAVVMGTAAFIVLRDLTGELVTSIASAVTMGVFGYALSASLGQQAKAELAAREAVNKAATDVVQKMDLGTLFEFNRREIDRYHVLTRGQARRSFWMSLGMMTIGFAVLVIGSFVAISQRAPETKIVIAALTGIGTLVSGYIGATFVRAYERALVQLNYYFQQPLVMNYVLTAERLVEQRLPKDGRPEISREIIRHVLMLGQAVSEHAPELLKSKLP